MYNDVLLSRFLRNGSLDSRSTPESVTRILARDRQLAARVTEYDCHDRTHSMKVFGWCLAIMASAEKVRSMTLSIDTLEALSGLQSACPYLRFPGLEELGVRSEPLTPLRSTALTQCIDFVQGLSFTKAACYLGSGAGLRCPLPLDWSTYVLFRTLVSLPLRRLYLSWRHYDMWALPQVTSLIENIRATLVLSLAFDWPLRLLSNSIAPSINWMRFTFTSSQLPEVLEVLADPAQLPNLRHIPRLVIVKDVEADEPILAVAAIDRTIDGLRKRGVRKLDERAPKFYELLKPYTLEESES